MITQAARKGYVMNRDLQSAIRWRVNMTHSFRVSVLLVAALATHAAAQPILIDDFNDGNADGWTTVVSTVGQPYGPGTFDASSGAYHLEGADLIPVGLAGGLISIWDQSSDPMYSNGFVRAKIRAETMGTIASVGFRASGSVAGAFNVYLFYGSTGPNPGFFFERIESGLGTVEFRQLDPNLTFGVDEDWYIEAGGVGDQLSMKVWRVGDPEPDSPQLMFADSNFSTGTFGIQTSRNVYFPDPARISATFDDIYFTPIPEPSTFLLALVALGVAGGWRKWRG
jgi:hypothetical protein